MKLFGYSILLVVAFTCIVASGTPVTTKELKKRILEKLEEELNKNSILNVGDIDGNAYVDEVLNELKTEIDEQNLDPYKVEDIDFLGVHTTGYIGGYSTIHRVGDAAVTQTETEIFVTVDLAIYNLEGIFNWTYTFLFIDYNGDVDVQVDAVDLYLSMQGPIVSGSSSVILQIEALEIQSIGRITVEVHGFGIFDELIDIISQAFANLVKDLIPFLIEDIVKVILNNVLEEFPCPLPEPAQ